MSKTVAAGVVANSNAVDLPMLTKTNYREWSLVMQVSLEALGLWDVVEADKPERRENRLALAAILRGVPSEMKAELAVKKSAKEAWAAVKTMRQGEARVKQANAQRLLKEFENVAFLDGETIDDFSLRIKSIAGNLTDLGVKLEDGRVVRKILRVVPKKFSQIALAIETLLDLDSMSVEELVGRLRPAEDRSAEEEADEIGTGVKRLLLTEKQWEARRRQRGKELARGGDARRDGKKGGGRSGGHDDKDDDASSTCSGKSRSGRRHRGRCYTCGERRHIVRFCSETRKKALLASADDEPALF